MKQFKPTQPTALRRGELATKDDIFWDYIQRHDTGLEGFVRDESHMQPAQMQREITVNVKPSLVGRNWGLANIKRYAHMAMP